MQDDPADQLHVEVAHADGAAGGLAHGGEGLGQYIVELLALPQPPLELGGLRAQGLVGEGLELGLKAADLSDDRLDLAHRPIVPVADNFLQPVEHLYLHREVSRLTDHT